MDIDGMVQSRAVCHMVVELTNGPSPVPLVIIQFICVRKCRKGKICANTFPPQINTFIIWFVPFAILSSSSYTSSRRQRNENSFANIRIICLPTYLLAHLLYLPRVEEVQEICDRTVFANLLDYFVAICRSLN